MASGIYDAFIDLSERGWQKDCDIAAALLILSEAGGFYTDTEGKKFKFKNLL
ncbi:fructose-1,6-bisphosphatase/inositol monophosphatase family enzyme [Bacillus atrophaeus]|nr:fructose-1,6-bisphosphatase/inositol monophosphatase family enzyme [Bacillus atrophaeus]